MTESEYYFDTKAADRVVDFIEKTLYHVKGEWAGKPFLLLDWQKEQIVKPLFGWKRPDGVRKYRQAFIALPRKNAKSTLSAALALYTLFADKEYGAEVYSCAGDKEQARLVFSIAKSMVETSPTLSKVAKVYKNAIEYPKLDAVYKVISADAYSKHGFNTSACVFDEIHVQKNRELYDVMASSVGARRQPLMMMLTTAGQGTNSICRELWDYAEGVKKGGIIDDSFFQFLAEASPEDDWTDPEVWAKANPGLGTTISLEYLQEACEYAKRVPAAQNTFKRLHLNLWTSQESRWIETADWDACNAPLPDLTGRVCYGGLDLSSVSDLTAFSLVFPPEKEGEPTYILPHFWIPEANIAERERKDRVPYSAWARDGFLHTTSGNAVDYDAVLETILELNAKYKLVDVNFDRWGATQISTKLADAGIQMVQFGQGYVSMSAPAKEFLRMVLSRELAHGGQPVLRWNVENVVTESDSAGNIKPSKSKSREKIDGVISTVMAIDRMQRHAASGNKVSRYESGGIVVF